MAANRRSQTYDVFVGNLPPDANEKNIGKLFIAYGEIAGIFVKESQKAKGPNNKYAFVKFMCEEDADRVVSEMDKKVIEGVEIAVKKSDKRNLGDAANKKRIKGSDGDGGAGFQGGGGAGHEQEKEDEPEVLPRPGKEKEKVLITHVENPCTLWVQVVNDDNTAKMFNIAEQLASLCPAAKKVSSQPDLGKVYGCLYTEDSMWYRCQAKQCFGTDKYKILYIDYGNSEEVSAGSLVELPPSLANIRGLAIKVILHNIKAKDLGDKQALQFLKELTDNQMALLQKTRPLADNCGYYGHIFIQDQSVGEIMLQAGYAAQMKFGLTRPGQSGGPEPLMQIPLPGLPPSPFTGMGPQQQQQLPQQQMNMSYKMPLGQRDNNKDWQTELKKKKKELDKMKSERDSASRQVEYMRAQIKTVQEEFAMAAAKLQDDTLSRRVNNVMKLATLVRHLREQFPTDSKSCVLDEALDLCSDPEKIDQSKCTSLGEVGSSLNRYKAAQDEIKKCKELGELSDLIESRDEVRRELHKNLSVCIEELQTLPLEARSKQLQEKQQKLVSVYSEYVKLQVQDCPSVKNVASSFKVWKSKKDAEFTDVRTATTFIEGALQTALSQLQQCLNVSSASHCERSEVDIDELMKTYSIALQREISVTDMVHTKDATQVATVIAAVCRELQSEVTIVDNLSVLQKEFTERKKNIEPWLNNKPSFTEVQENRKLLRSLKSKLRHTLADKIDLEESGSEGELDNVKEEEVKIRQQIQAVLAKADSLQHEVADLSETNFPEMMVQYPDLGIDGYSVYKGLVKANREIDHYQLGDCLRPGLHLSTFNKEPVILQELHVGDSDHCSREDFLSQVLAYNGNTNSLQAVFFSKNERQVYVQGAGKDDLVLVESIINDPDRFTPHQLQQICLQLVTCVNNLHKRGIIHGEVTPQSLLISKDNSVILLWPDFSRTIQERMNKRYTTENGLVFQCLDQQSTSPESVAMATDIYCLVLLLFWLHCPNQKVTKQPGSSPDPAKRLPNIDPSLQTMFEDILRARKAAQTSAEMVLALEYFKKTLPDTHEPPPAPVPSPVPQQVIDTVPGSSDNAVPGQMEIGVFRAEDYVRLPEVEAIQVAADTDDSWTTKSSSSASRTSSPLDTTQAATAAAAAAATTTETVATSVTDSVQTVIEADVHSGGDTLISGDTSEDNEPIEIENNSSQCNQDNVGQRMEGDIFSQAQFSDFLVPTEGHNGDGTGQAVGDVGVGSQGGVGIATEKGAACESEVKKLIAPQPSLAVPEGSRMVNKSPPLSALLLLTKLKHDQ